MIMRFQDLVFNEIEGATPPQLVCNGYGNSGVTLAAEILLPRQDGVKALIVLCSRGCESALKRDPMADQFLAEFMVNIERASGGDAEWPEEIDA